MTDWLYWSNTTSQEEWTTWQEWQKHQLATHYEKSEIFQYYLKYRPEFQPPRYSCITGHSSRQYIYCFGDFASLIVNPHGGGNVVDYFTTILDIYDVCKGSSRRIKGDPEGIALIRDVVQKRNLAPIKNHNFNQYTYDYSILHAHTVAQYSLSTLILRLASHYMSYVTTQGDYCPISLQACQKAYEKCIFGEPRGIAPPSSSKPVDIPFNKPTMEERPLSWPRDNATCIRCKTCSRVTENVWGKFEACLDCHLKRICSECGMQAVIIGADTFPKCYYHQGKK